MYLIQFKPEEIDKVWPLVKDKVQSALERNHEGKKNPILVVVRALVPLLVHSNKAR